MLFGDGDPSSTNLNFGAALPLSATGATSYLFSHIAQGQGFYTGLAFLAPDGADLEVEAFRENGSSNGTKSVSLMAGERITALLFDLIPSTRDQVGGYVKITSSKPIIAFELFGATDGRFLSAISPQPIGSGISGRGPEASFSDRLFRRRDTKPPVISGVAVSSITSWGATVRWTTNEPSDTQVEYGTTTAYGSSTLLNKSLVTNHSAALAGLAGSQLYHYRVRSQDVAGNRAVSGDFTFTTAAMTDTTPPLISGVEVSSITSSGATIRWTTNEPSDTQVEYGTTTAYGSSMPLNTSLVTSHSVALGGLAGSTLYHYRVRSQDAAGNRAISGDFTFTTPATTPPSGKILWSANHETGNMSQWYYPSTGPSGNYGGGQFNSGVGTSDASQDFAHSGSYSAKLTVTTPPESGVRLFRWSEPRAQSELYYSVWYYFPQKYDTPAGWWNVFQWKSKNAAGKNDPFFILNVGNRGGAGGPMYFYLYDWQLRRSYSSSAVKDIPVGRWFHVEAFYKSAGDTTGRVTVWQDGTLLFDVHNVRTRYADGDCQWSVNNYSGLLSPNPTTIYVDDAAISTARIGISAAYSSTQLLRPVDPKYAQLARDPHNSGSQFRLADPQPIWLRRSLSETIHRIGTTPVEAIYGIGR